MIGLTEMGKLNMASTVSWTGGPSLNEKKKASRAPEFISAANKELNVSSYSLLLVPHLPHHHGLYCQIVSQTLLPYIVFVSYLVLTAAAIKVMIVSF